MILRPYQRQAINCTWQWMRQHDGNPAIVLPTGCHAAGTMILMADGSAKAVESVVPGDLLMGPDSKPRTVLQLARGREEMFKVTPKKGEPFVVNGGHVLALRTTNEGKRFPSNTTGDEFECVTVFDWLKKAKSWKHLRKLFRSPADFPIIGRPSLSPWAVGALLGDGCLIYGIQFSKPDEDILDAIWAEMEAYGLEYTARHRGGAWHIRFTDPEANRSRPNRVFEILRDIGLAGTTSETKFIPDCYKLGDRQCRLDVLAGLMDTDGHLSHNSFDYISKSQQLANDVVFVARSLGLAAYVAKCRKGCQTGAVGTYWRVSVSGDVDMIPNRCARKKAGPRQQKKNPLVTGFSVDPVGVGEFYGFQLDGDHLYLTADFTVHHNSGKSPVMGALAQEACQQWQARVAILAHTKELVRQNAEKLAQVWPNADLGIYSASLKRRDRFNQVLSCQIQSVAKRAGQLGRFNLILIDEAHRIPLKGEGLYLQFIAECRRFNPDLRVIGLTATPYRLQGAAVPVCGPNYILNEISYESRIGDLIADGYLSALVSKGGRTRPDLQGVHIRGGEYIESELARAVDREELVSAACDEIVDLAADRRALIVFCVSVEHAEHVQAALIARGVTTGLVHGKTPAAERDATIGEYQAGKLRALCNVNVLSEGFDAPHVDCVVMLRPTKSPGLYYQQVGRGLRLHPSKTDCLVLDFAGNVIEHGPVDEIRVSKPRERKPSEVQTGVSKECPKCLCIVPAATRVCPDCEHEWPEREIRHLMTATGAPILGAHVAPVSHAVDSVSYDEHLAKSGVLTLLVVYRCGLLSFREWVCFEHEGFARRKAESWWAQRSRAECPALVEHVLNAADSLRKPSAVFVKESGKYPEIVGYEFDRDDTQREGASNPEPARSGDDDRENAHGNALSPMRQLRERLLRGVEIRRAG